jgi:hypothetical protein
MAKFISRAAIGRLATWVLPPHRKEWAEAMLNEIAYIESRRIAVRWFFGCALFVISERTSYELEKAFMNYKIFKIISCLGIATVIAVMGIYAVQKPYQKERIKIALHRAFDAKQTQAEK